MQAARFDVTRLGPTLEAIHERLAGVVIERLRWADFLIRYDRPGTLFYLDPPYMGHEEDYGRGMFARAEFEDLDSVASTERRPTPTSSHRHFAACPTATAQAKRSQPSNAQPPIWRFRPASCSSSTSCSLG